MFQTVYMKQTIYGKVYTAASMYDVIKVNYESLQAFGAVQLGAHCSGMCSTLDVRCLIF